MLLFCPYTWFTARAVFAHPFSQRGEDFAWPTRLRPGAGGVTRPCVRSFEQGDELRALAVDLRGRSGVVESDDIPQRPMELLTCPGVLVVEGCDVDVPAPGDLPDRHPFVESE